MSDTLSSFGLEDKATYQQWWIERRATNHTVWTDRYTKIMELIPPEKQKILEIGCQTGGFTIPLLQAGHEVTAVDIVPLNLDTVGSNAKRQNMRQRLTPLLSFAEDLEFVDQFDIVLLCEVLIHCRDDQEVLSRAIRAAKPGGKIIVSVPYYDDFQGVEISRYYTEEDFAALISSQADTFQKVPTVFVLWTGPEAEHPHTFLAELVK